GLRAAARRVGKGQERPTGPGSRPDAEPSGRSSARTRFASEEGDRPPEPLVERHLRCNPEDDTHPPDVWDSPWDVLVARPVHVFLADVLDLRPRSGDRDDRSEEHTSELQSR